MHLSKRLIFVFFLISTLAVLSIPPSAQARKAKQTKQQLMHRLADVNRQLSDVQSKLAHTKRMQRSAYSQLMASEHRLEAARNNLMDAQSQLRTTRGKLVVTRTELHKVETRLGKRNNLLSERLSDTYKHGNVGYVNVLLGATDFWDLLNRGHMIREVLNSDVQLIGDIKQDKHTVETHKAVLEVQERKRSDLERQQAVLTQVAHNQAAERGQILKQISRERSQYENMLAELEQNSRQIATMIRAMQRTPRGHKRYTQVWHGRFMAPVSGYRITDRFGMRYHPILHTYRMHTGVDLACPTGTTIHAAASGEIIFAGWLGAYGNAIIIDHGGGMNTVYGHCSRLLVRVGAVVKQGQSIGRVGSTGWSTGPHCHFEVRRNGTPIRPM